jgi:hypothetical protein
MGRIRRLRDEWRRRQLYAVGRTLGMQERHVDEIVGPWPVASYRQAFERLHQDMRIRHGGFH